MVKLSWARHAQKTIEDNGVKNTEFLEYEDMQHSVCEEEIDDVCKWLQRVAPALAENMTTTQSQQYDHGGDVAEEMKHAIGDGAELGT